MFAGVIGTGAATDGASGKVPPLLLLEAPKG